MCHTTVFHVKIKLCFWSLQNILKVNLMTVTAHSNYQSPSVLYSDTAVKTCETVTVIINL